MYVFINDHLFSEKEALISVKDRGLLLGDGLFETLRTKQGRLLFFDEHYVRFQQSADFLGIPWCYSCEWLKAACQQVLEANHLLQSSGALRVTLTRGQGSGRGIHFASAISPTCIIMAEAYSPPTNYPRACMTALKRNTASPITHHKTLNYLECVLARQEAIQRGFDEGILLNTQGYVAECSVANLFFLHGDQVITPSVDSGILPGITRKRVIALCAQLGITLVEKCVTVDEAVSASEAWQTNSLIGLQPLSAINHKPFSVLQSSLTRKLVQAYEAL
ncbi:MAG: hypothetical protein A3F41_03105 [Coxiella sp. RIFCSPHIGHO2_12_FULL_44_14]|nr:MAG: hypothetical protein A3F41_03105 [Coxiella sp. RIFCSPHIGHO2_12_FULL_44_14]